MHVHVLQISFSAQVEKKYFLSDRSIGVREKATTPPRLLLLGWNIKQTKWDDLNTESNYFFLFDTYLDGCQIFRSVIRGGSNKTMKCAHIFKSQFLNCGRIRIRHQTTQVPI